MIPSSATLVHKPRIADPADSAPKHPQALGSGFPISTTNAPKKTDNPTIVANADHRPPHPPANHTANPTSPTTTSTLIPSPKPPYMVFPRDPPPIFSPAVIANTSANNHCTILMARFPKRKPLQSWAPA